MPHVLPITMLHNATPLDDMSAKLEEDLRDRERGREGEGDRERGREGERGREREREMTIIRPFNYLSSYR